MGSPKALLTTRGRTFLGQLVDAFAAGGCDAVVVVTGPETENDAVRIAAEARSLGARVVVNPHRDAPQIASLRAALRALPNGTRAALVSPVDSPGATPAIVAAMITAAEGAPIVVATHGGRRGHPVLFAASVFDELLEGSLPEGARSLIRSHGDSVRELEVGDDGVLLDVDTPEEYRRLREAQ